MNIGGKQTNIAWDDVRVFLAVFRSGSVAAASRALGVTHVTVGRRLAALEEAVGCLFERCATGYELTLRGRELLPGAEAMETGMRELRRALVKETQARATVRLAIPEPLNELVLDGLEGLRETAPELVVELVTGTHLVSMKRREADVALRLWRHGQVPGESDTLSKRVGGVPWSVYSSPALVERLELTLPLESLSGVPWVGYSDRAPYIPGDTWLREMPGEPRPIVLSSSLPTVLAAVERGLGLGVLPDLLAARRGLVAASGPVESTAVWLAVHPTSKNDPYVRRLRDHVEQMVASW